MLRVTVWNENLHERTIEEVRRVYPEGIHGCLASFLQKEEAIIVRTATFEEPEHGLTSEVLAGTDVLIFWSHALQDEFSDEVADRVCEAVRSGMGLIALHSAHFSKIMKRLMGTSMTLTWRNDDRERLFVTAPAHPIAKGIPASFELFTEEMYGEYFDIPKPEDVVFTGWFAGGEVFRSGCTFTRGLGKIFYFQPGHETCPTYHDPIVQKIITNAVYWCAPERRLTEPLSCPEIKLSLEDRYRIQTRGRTIYEGIRLSVFYEHIREAARQKGLTEADVFSKVRLLGISGIDVELDVLVQNPTLFKVCYEAGMQVSSMYVFLELGKDKKAGIEKGKAMIDLASEFGVQNAMVIPGFLDTKTSEKLWDCEGDYGKLSACMEGIPELCAMRDGVRELSEYAVKKRVVLSMEDFDSFESPIATSQRLLWFLSGCPFLFHTLDLGNYAFSNEDPLKALQKFKGRISGVHCKDRGEEPEDQEKLRRLFSLPKEAPVQFRKGLKPVPVGGGYVPVGQVVKELMAEGFQGFLSIEHFGAPDQLSFIERSVVFLSKVLGENSGKE